MRVLGGWSDGIKFYDMLRNASKAALVGANKTIEMQAAVGRASYVSPEKLVDPDPGATAVAIWMHIISQIFLTQA